MSGDLLKDGLNLMAFGMGAVFIFLTMLVIATSIMTVIVRKLFPAIQPEKSSRAPGAGIVDPQIVSAIMAAIKLHRSKKQQ